MYIKNDDTICAPATIPGTGAITVIRVSGADALAIADKVVTCRKGKISEAPGYSIRFGTVCGDGGRIIDEVLVSVFKAPRSYTGENSVEISCHASSYIAEEILELLREAGARSADPGEFTQRAFLNGKMDLAQAEAVADVIAAQNAAAHRVAFSQMKGGFSGELKVMRDELLRIVSLMELELDFSEEDVEFADRSELNRLLDEITGHITRLIDSFRLGNAIKNGVPVAIAGATNTGKSTLLNALLGEDRAIVSDIHGTTRDTIEETLNIEGVLFRFIDTAGIRETTETVEKIGIEKTYRKISQAAVVLAMLDLTRGFEENCESVREVAGKVDSESQEVVFLLNKADVAGFSGIVSDKAADGTGVAGLHGGVADDADGTGEVMDDTTDYTSDRAADRTGVAGLHGGAADGTTDGTGEVMDDTTDYTSDRAADRAGVTGLHGRAADGSGGTVSSSESLSVNNCAAGMTAKTDFTVPAVSADGIFEDENSANIFVYDNNNIVTYIKEQTFGGSKAKIFPISAKTGSGLDGLRHYLAESQKNKMGDGSMTLVTNQRHLDALKAANTSLLRVSQALADHVPTDLAAQDLREAIYHLGSIVGEISTDEVLGNIFKNFCIGK